MTGQEIANLVMTICFIGGFAVVGLVMFRQRGEYEKYAIGVLDKKLLPIHSNIGEYKFYTTGHPYVWVETNYLELCENIKSHCNSISGNTATSYAVGPANVMVRINEENKAVYVVISDPSSISSKWPQLMHYDEWIESDKQHAEKIEQYENGGKNA